MEPEMRFAYYLVYRVPLKRDRIDWGKPTGGLVLSISVKATATTVAAEHYHVAPHEELVLAEVYSPVEMALARQLAATFICDKSSFLELMAC